MYRDFSSVGYRAHYDVSYLFGRNYKSRESPRLVGTLDECKARVQTLGIKSGRQYSMAYEAGMFNGFPPDPSTRYRVRWAELLGKRPNGANWRPYRQFQRRLKELEIESRAQYHDARKAGLLDGFPASPVEVYGIPWFEMLGKPMKGCWPTLSKLQLRVRKLGLTRVREFHAARQSGLLDAFPSNPNETYGVRWAEILGKRSNGPYYVLGRKVAWGNLRGLLSRTKRLNIKTIAEYHAARRAGLLDSFPSNPDVIYRVSWFKILNKRPCWG